MNKFVPFLVSTFLIFDNDPKDHWKYAVNGYKDFDAEFDNRSFDYNNDNSNVNSNKTICDYKTQVASINEIHKQKHSTKNPMFLVHLSWGSHSTD